MTAAAMCRVCLAEDVRMCRISDTHLQEMYETLCASAALGPDESRPMLACYICYAQLQNCYQLRRRCLRSQELYRRMLHNEECSEEKRRELRPGLAVVAVVQLGLGEAREGAGTVSVKQEVGGDAVDVPPAERAELCEGEHAGPLVCVKREPQDECGGIDAPMEDSTSAGLQLDVKVEEELSLEEQLVRSAERVCARARPFYFQCRACRRSFYSRARLAAHRCARAAPRALACALCARTFTQRARLLRHVRRHAARHAHRCAACGRSFPQRHQLARHALSHSDERPYRCERCDKRFVSRSYLARHAASHSAERPHRCDECGKTFKAKSNLVVHARRHSGEKPYQCSVCAKRFSSNGNLKKHLQIHSGVRPFGCDACDKAFINNSDLVKHRRTHTDTGEKPYRCDVCGETFNYNSNYLKHKRVSCKTGTV